MEMGTLIVWTSLKQKYKPIHVFFLLTGQLSTDFCRLIIVLSLSNLSLVWNTNIKQKFYIEVQHIPGIYGYTHFSFAKLNTIFYIFHSIKNIPTLQTPDLSWQNSASHPYLPMKALCIVRSNGIRISGISHSTSWNTFSNFLKHSEESPGDVAKLLTNLWKVLKSFLWS